MQIKKNIPIKSMLFHNYIEYYYMDKYNLLLIDPKNEISLIYHFHKKTVAASLRMNFKEI